MSGKNFMTARERPPSRAPSMRSFSFCPLDKYIYAIYTYCMIDFGMYQEFEWDEWNVRKNQEKHRVTVGECEQIFSDPRKQLFNNPSHSSKVEERFILIGCTDRGRVLYVAFTVRNKRIRVISARDLNRKERYLYEKRT